MTVAVPDRCTPGNVVIWLLWILAILAAAAPLVTSSGPPQWVGIVAAGAATITVFSPVSAARLWAAAAIGAVAFTTFLVHLVSDSEPQSLRWLSSVVSYGYAAVIVSGALGLVFHRAFGRLLLVAVSVAVSLVAAESAFETTKPPPPPSVRWVGGFLPHPILGEVYPPYSVLRTIYPDDPRGYFKQSEPRTSTWRLMLNHRGSVARLNLSAGDPGRARVDIERADQPDAWHIQLSHVGLAVRRGEKYQVSFRVRADAKRHMSYGVGQTHPPFKGLGWYREGDVGPLWTEVHDEFRAEETATEGRVQFDLGGSLVPVEVTEVSVRHAGSNANALRELPIEHYVEYRFNGRGCRGPDYEVPVRRSVRRILALGDSYTLGVGVHFEDTFTQQLERLLNGDATRPSQQPRYEVINCGVSGYATDQERMMFEVVGREYRPDVVLVAMVFNDNLSWRNEVEKGYVVVENRYDRLFPVWKLWRSARAETRRPEPDFSGTVKELLKLNDLTRAAGATLVVAIFRHSPEEGPWVDLKQAVAGGLEATDIPWMDLGDGIRAGFEGSELSVHEVDGHPNELAHRRAAEIIAGLLREHRLVDSPIEARRRIK